MDEMWFVHAYTKDALEFIICKTIALLTSLHHDHA